MENKPLEKNKASMFVQFVLIPLAGFIAFFGLAFYIFDMVSVWIVVLSALLANIIQFSLVKGLIEKLKNLAIQANELEVRLGYQPRDVDADDFVACNAAYAKMMILNALMSLLMPWVFVLISLII